MLCKQSRHNILFCFYINFYDIMITKNLKIRFCVPQILKTPPRYFEKKTNNTKIFYFYRNGFGNRRLFKRPIQMTDSSTDR